MTTQWMQPMRKWMACAGAAALVAIALAGAASAAPDEIAAKLQSLLAQRAPGLKSARLSEGERALAGLPLRFEANRGQADPSAAFVARTGGTLVFVRSNDLAIALPDASGGPSRLVHLRWVGGSAKPELHGEAEVAARSNYFMGRDAPSWVRDVPAFERVRVAEIYPGIDVVFYGSEGVLEFDFAVAPGADASQIRFAVDGGDDVAVDGTSITVRAGASTLSLNQPAVYQELDGRREPVSGGYALASDGSVRFALGSYDTAKPLVIDPVIAYSSYLGGAGRDVIQAVAVDSKGCLYVAGRTDSIDFPLASALFVTKGAGYTAFVAKLNPSGTDLIYSTFLGGTRTISGYDQMGVSVNVADEVVLVGETNDPAFPLANAWQSTLGGGFDAYVTKLNAGGNALVFSTYLGGSGEDYGRGVAFDPEGFLSVTGITFSTDFPSKVPFQPTRHGGVDAFVTRFQADGQPIFSTYLGGDGIEWGYEIAGGNTGESFVVGFTDSTNFPVTTGAYQTTIAGGSSDLFVTKLAKDGVLDWSTYVGGSGGEEALGVALGRDQTVYVAGWTQSTDFPTVNAFQSAPQGGDFDAYALKLSADGASLRYSTRIAGSGIDFAYAIAVDADGYATVVGNTNSTNFPTMNAVQANLAALNDSFVTRLSPTGNGLVFSTYLGGNSEENPFGMSFGVGLDPKGNVYVGQTTASTNFPKAPYVASIQSANHGALDGAITRISTGPEVQMRLRTSANGSAGRFRIGNGGTTPRPVELRFWIDTPAYGSIGILTITQPLVLSANLEFFELTFQLPALPFPGTQVGFRLLDPTTGEVLSESACGSVPCN